MPTTPRLLSVLAAVVFIAGACTHRAADPNILLITLDTTRRDHLGMYGYDRPTSPELDRLAADSTVYTNAYAVSSWTMPTHASMFTGKFPSAHGANYDPEGPLQLSAGIEGPFGHYRARPIAEGETTLAQILARRGYSTGGGAGGPWMKKVFQLDRGFAFYNDEHVTALNGRPADDVTRAAIEFLEEHGDEPFFLFVNYYDPHGPWTDASGRPLHDLEPVLPTGVDLSALGYVEQAEIVYDAEVHFMDEHLGRLLEHLRAEGLYENTWIFVLSDHGELLGDDMLGDPAAHDKKGLWGHGDSLTQAEIHIPFLVKQPGPQGRTGEDATPVQQVDLLPTILTRLGIPLPPNVQGRPIDGQGTEHPIVAELYKLPMMNRITGPNPKDWRHLGDWRALVKGDTKFGWSSNGTHFLIDLSADPLELTNLAQERAELARSLEQELTSYLAALPAPGATGPVEPVDEETLKQLEGLGYVGKDEDPPPEKKAAAEPGARAPGGR